MASSDSPTPSTHCDLSQSLHWADEHDLILRLMSAGREGQLLRIAGRKILFGSAQDCGLCLKSNQVAPIHGLIIRGRVSTIVRAFADDTRLNGRSFVSAELNLHDRLSIGPIELQVAALALSPSASIPELERPEHARDTARDLPRGRQFDASSLETTIESLNRSKQVVRARTRRLVNDLREAREQIARQHDRLLKQQDELQQGRQLSDSLEHRLAQLEARIEEFDSWDVSRDEASWQTIPALQEENGATGAKTESSKTTEVIGNDAILQLTDLDHDWALDAARQSEFTEVTEGEEEDTAVALSPTDDRVTQCESDPDASDEASTGECVSDAEADTVEELTGDELSSTGAAEPATNGTEHDDEEIRRDDEGQEGHAPPEQLTERIAASDDREEWAGLDATAQDAELETGLSEASRAEASATEQDLSALTTSRNCVVELLGDVKCDPDSETISMTPEIAEQLGLAVIKSDFGDEQPDPPTEQEGGLEQPQDDSSVELTEEEMTGEQLESVGEPLSLHPTESKAATETQVEAKSGDDNDEVRSDESSGAELNHAGTTDPSRYPSPPVEVENATTLEVETSPTVPDDQGSRFEDSSGDETGLGHLRANLAQLLGEELDGGAEFNSADSETSKSSLISPPIQLTRHEDEAVVEEEEVAAEPESEAAFEESTPVTESRAPGGSNSEETRVPVEVTAAAEGDTETACLNRVDEQSASDFEDSLTDSEKSPTHQVEGVEEEGAANELEHVLEPDEATADLELMVEDSSPAGGEEDSIEEYMAKLLQRVRGEVPTELAAPKSKESSVIKPPSSLVKEATNSSPTRVVARTEAEVLAEAFAPEIEARKRDFASSNSERRSETTENRDELRAMREVANTSARSAIQVSQKKREMSTAATQLAGAIGATLFGAAMVGLSDSLASLTFLLALVSWGGGAFLCYRCYIWYRDNKLEQGVKGQQGDRQETGAIDGNQIEAESAAPLERSNDALQQQNASSEGANNNPPQQLTLDVSVDAGQPSPNA